MSSLGFLTFIVIAVMAFWVLIFLVGVLPYWIGLYILEQFKPKLAAKLAGYPEEEDEA